MRQNGKADVAAHGGGDARRLQDVVDQRGGGRFAVGAGDADDFVRGQFGAGLSEEFDVADDGDSMRGGVGGDGVAIERHAG